MTHPLAAAVLGAALAALGACAADPIPTAPNARPRPARAAAAATTGALGGPATAGDNAVVRWDDALLRAARAARPGPTVVSRAIAVAHTAMYDAWTAYDSAALGTQYNADGAMRRPATDRPGEDER